MIKQDCIDLDSKEGQAAYKGKSVKNWGLFNRVLGVFQEELFTLREGLHPPNSNNSELLARLCRITGLSTDSVHDLNNIYEAFWNFAAGAKSCTSVGREGVIGQNFDHYTFDYSVVKEGGSLYITIPPCLCLFGMNRDISFCTNYLPGDLFQGFPVSHVRRDLLRCHSLEEIREYLTMTPLSTSVNILASDGRRMENYEVAPGSVRIFQAVQHPNGEYLAHTNHFLSTPLNEDVSCPRLYNAVRQLEEGNSLEQALTSEGVFVTVEPWNGGGVGSVLTAILDVRGKKILYRHHTDNAFSEMSLE